MKLLLRSLTIILVIISVIVSVNYSEAETDLFAVSYTTYDTTYDAIIKMYIKVLNKYGTGKTGRHDLFNSLVIADFDSDYDSPLEKRITDTKNRVGYCIFDLNGDGTDELIIGESPTYVYEVFTIDNGKVRELIRAGYHYQCVLMTEGRFFRYSKDGGGWDSYTIWKMNGTGKVRFAEGYLRDAYSNPDLAELHNDIVFYKMNSSNMRYGTTDTYVDADVFLSWIRKHNHEVPQLRFIPLSLAEQGSENDYQNIGIVSVKGKTRGNSTVRIRTKPNSKSKVLVNCKVGTYVIILGEEDDYYMVRVGKKEGYINKDYLSLFTEFADGRQFSLGYNEYRSWIKDDQ